MILVMGQESYLEMFQNKHVLQESSIIHELVLIEDS